MKSAIQIFLRAMFAATIMSSTQFSIVIFRTQLFNPGDMPNVIKIQNGYKTQPLSAFLKQPAPSAAPAINFPKINKELAKTKFFEYLDFALQFAPPGPEDKEIRAKLANIGKDLSPEQKAAVALGMPEYHNAKHEQFLGLNKQAADVADEGVKSGETGDKYVRITVLLATVLLITAIGQRFRFKSVRIAFMVLAFLLLCLPLWQLLVLPRI